MKYENGRKLLRQLGLIFRCQFGCRGLCKGRRRTQDENQAAEDAGAHE
jgi:hypothetical protein